MQIHGGCRIHILPPEPLQSVDGHRTLGPDPTTGHLPCPGVGLAGFTISHFLVYVSIASYTEALGTQTARKHDKSRGGPMSAAKKRLQEVGQKTAR